MPMTPSPRTADPQGDPQNRRRDRIRLLDSIGVQEKNGTQEDAAPTGRHRSPAVLPGQLRRFPPGGQHLGETRLDMDLCSQPVRPACPTYAASPPPPRPLVRRVRPSGRTGCTPAPLPEGSAARRNTRLVSASYCRQGPARCHYKKAALSPHPGQRSPKEVDTAGTRRALQISTSGIRRIFLLFPRESWQHRSIPVST